MSSGFDVDRFFKEVDSATEQQKKQADKFVETARKLQEEMKKRGVRDGEVEEWIFFNNRCHFEEVALEVCSDMDMEYLTFANGKICQVFNDKVTVYAQLPLQDKVRLGPHLENLAYSAFPQVQRPEPNPFELECPF